MSWWAAALWQISPALLVSWAVWMIASIVLHELGHGWAAIKRGDDTPIHTGHMTINPLVHMGPWSLLAFALVGIAWGAMPVDPTRLKGRYAGAAVAAAGPAMNVGLAATCIVLGAVLEKYLPGLGVPDGPMRNLRVFFFAGGALNIALALFNLVPIPPLDGWRVLSDFWRGYAAFMDGEVGRGVAFIGFGVLFFTAGGVLLGAAFGAYRFGSAFVMGLLP